MNDARAAGRTGIAAVAATTRADPGAKTKPADPERPADHAAPPKQTPKTSSEDHGRSKRDAGDDFNPATSPKRKDGNKVIVIAEITIEGRLARPAVLFDVRAPLLASAAPAGDAGAAGDVAAAIDVVAAAHDYARARRDAHLDETRTPQSADALATTRGAAAALLDAYTSGPALVPATLALVDARWQRDDNPEPSLQRAEALLESTAGDANRRALALAVLNRRPSLGAALALLCPGQPDRATRVAALAIDACDARALAPAEAAFAWFQLGRELREDSPLGAARAYQHAAATGSPAIAAIASFQRGEALYGADRLGDAALAFAGAWRRATAAHAPLIARYARAWVAEVVAEPLATWDVATSPDARDTLARIAALFPGDADDAVAIRAAISGEAAMVFTYMTQYDGAVTLLRAALAARPLAAEAPLWHAGIVSALGHQRDLSARDAEAKLFATAYGDDSAWLRAHRDNADAQRFLAAARRPDPNLDELVVGSVPDVVLDVARRSLPSLRRCLDQAELPSATAVVNLDTSPAGDVTSVDVSGLADATATRCVTSIVRGWRVEPSPERTARNFPIYVTR